MTFWLLILLSLLGYFCYVFIVQRVQQMTRTPAWLLWLVVMMPALCLTAWALVMGSRTPMPTPLGLLLFVGCFVLYVYLIQRGRLPTSSGSSEAANARSPEERPVPEVLPESLAEPMTVRSLTTEEETELRQCFPWGTYFLQNIEYRPQAVICRGQLRVGPDAAYRTVAENVKAQFGNRFFLVFQEGPSEKPFFALVPNPQGDLKITPQMIRQPGLALMLALMTALMTTWSGQELIKQVGLSSMPKFLDGLPYAIALMGFFIIREGGHYWTTLRYRIPATLPYFIPMLPLPQLPIGTVGAFIQIRSPIPNRKALFDIGVIGAVMGLIAAIGLLAYGLSLSQVIPLPPGFRPSVFKFEAMLPQYSLLLTLLAKAALGSALEAKSAIALHPIAVAGWLGVLFTAFNLMPVGQLDGGRMVHAIFGQRQGAMIGQIGRLTLLLLSIMQPHLFLWAVLLFFLPTIDEPTLNDVTELDNTRDAIGMVMLVVLLLIIVPAPKILLTTLGMGV
jgi:membrane-associated protease RseP (regulator of RpoE activity)